MSGDEEKYKMAAMSSTASQMKRGPNSGKQRGTRRKRESCWLWVVYGTGRRVGPQRAFSGAFDIGPRPASFSQLLA